jgi:hypothetical protein
MTLFVSLPLSTELVACAASAISSSCHFLGLLGKKTEQVGLTVCCRDQKINAIIHRGNRQLRWCCPRW